MLQQQQRPDSYRHKGLRAELIAVIRAKGIQDERVLAAINKIPRHFFLDTAFEFRAYNDEAFPIGAGQTISQPYTVAYQTQLLQVQPFDKILEVGTGSAYQACVLAELGASVYTIERQKKLYEYNNHFHFLQHYPRLKRFYGDGFAGLPSYAPFDKVIITAAAPEIPPLLLQQLKLGGIMVLPLDDPEQEGVQRMMRITKTESGYDQDLLDLFSFVPMLGGTDKGSFHSY